MADHLNARADEAERMGWFDDKKEADGYRREVRNVLHQAIFEGAPFPGLEAENGAHLDVANTLAREGQELLEIRQSSDWKHGVWFTLEEEIGPRLHGNARQLLQWLIRGRPVFGRRFDTGWERYAYLAICVSCQDGG
jgi:hypothetical protein